MNDVGPAVSVAAGVLYASLVAASAGAWWTAAVRWSGGKAAIRLRPRRRVPWGVEGAVLAGFCILLGWASALAMARADEPPELTLGLDDALSHATISLILAGGIWGLLRSAYAANGRDFGMPRSPREAAGDTGLGLVVFAAAVAPVYALQVLLVYGFDLRNSHPTIDSLLADPGWGTIAGALISAVVVAPLFEEFAFRVLLQGWLERLGGRRAWWPIFASSAAFAAAHAGQGWAPVPLFLLSLHQGYLYRQTHRFVPVVVMHAAFNLLSLAAILLSPEAARPPADAVEPPAEPAGAVAALVSDFARRETEPDDEQSVGAPTHRVTRGDASRPVEAGPSWPAGRAG